MKKFLEVFYFPILGALIFFIIDRLNFLLLLYSKTKIIYYLCELMYGEKNINFNNLIGVSISFTGLIFLLFFSFFLIFIKNSNIKIGIYISIICSFLLIVYGLW